MNELEQSFDGSNVEIENSIPNSAKSTRRRLIKRAIFGGLALSILTTVWAHEGAPEYIRFVELDVPIPNLPTSAEGLRIGHISDTHCDSPRALARATRAAKLLHSQKPDVVLLTGDYITVNPAENMPGTADVLALLNDAKFGAFAVMGNHDWWSGNSDSVAAEMSRVGIKMLRNQSCEIGSTGLWAVGLEQRSNNLQNASLALEDVPADAVKLLMVHEPDYADEAPNGFALQLSGHSHGGQVRVPFLPPIVVPMYGRKYPEGLQQAKNHLVYTTRGVGMVGPKFRLFCAPEVAVLRLIRG